MDERKFAVEYIQATETAVTSLFRKGKERDAMWVLKDATEVLQSLGFLKKKALAIDLKAEHTFIEILKLSTEIMKDENNVLSKKIAASKNGTYINTSGELRTS